VLRSRPEGSGIAGLGEQIANDRYCIGSRSYNITGVLAPDASDRNQRKRCQRPEMAEFLQAYDRIWIRLRVSPKNWTERDVVDRLGCGVVELLLVMRGEADERLRAENATSIRGWQVILTEMQRSAEQTGDIGAIIHHKQRAGALAEVVYATGRLEDGTGEMAFVAKLENAGSRVEEFGTGSFGGDTARVEQPGIENRIEARQAGHRPS